MKDTPNVATHPPPPSPPRKITRRASMPGTRIKHPIPDLQMTLPLHHASPAANAISKSATHHGSLATIDRRLHHEGAPTTFAATTPNAQISKQIMLSESYPFPLMASPTRESGRRSTLPAIHPSAQTRKSPQMLSHHSLSQHSLSSIIPQLHLDQQHPPLHGSENDFSPAASLSCVGTSPSLSASAPSKALDATTKESPKHRLSEGDIKNRASTLQNGSFGDSGTIITTIPSTSPVLRPVESTQGVSASPRTRTAQRKLADMGPSSLYAFSSFALLPVAVDEKPRFGIPFISKWQQIKQQRRATNYCSNIDWDRQVDYDISPQPANGSSSNLHSSEDSVTGTDQFLMYLPTFVRESRIFLFFAFVFALFVSGLTTATNTYRAIKKYRKRKARQAVRNSPVESRKMILRKLMTAAPSCEVYHACAKELDQLEGLEAWKENPVCLDYDYRLIKARLELLKGLSALGNMSGVKATLRSGLLRDLGGLGNSNLYAYTHTGTKYLIEEYISEVTKQLLHIYGLPDTMMSLHEKFDFFFETRQSFGRSALLLSGGASLGMYHLGVIKVLFEQGLLPRVISGASAGSLVAALVSVLTDEEIPIIFEKGSLQLNAFSRRKRGEIRRKIWRLFSEGVLMDIRLLEEVVRDNIGNITFKEAFDRTGRILNITISSTNSYEMPRIMNYLTSPEVLIWSAACASCALKFLYKPVELYCKDQDGNIRVYQPSSVKWSDGSVEADLPMRRLSELFNVNHFIVSQVNPHVVPFLQPDLFAQETMTTKRTFWGRILGTLRWFILSETKHRAKQILDIVGQKWSAFGIGMLISQKYTGDISVVPKIKLFDYLKIISNPTSDWQQRCISKGALYTYPKVALIRNHTQIEQVLEECVKGIRKRIFPTVASVG